MRAFMRVRIILVLVAMGMTTLALNPTSPVTAQALPTQYILLGVGGVLPAGLDGLVASVGGQLVAELGDIGVAIAQSSDPNFVLAAASILGIQGVAADRPVLLDLPDQGNATFVDDLDATNPLDPTVTDLTSFDVSTLSLDATWQTIAPQGLDPTQAKFFFAQWNMRAISAPAAWTAKGLGIPSVKVAVVDTGIDYTHQELVGQVDMTLSRSFFAEPLPRNAAPFLDVQGHGTHVAGIIAGMGRKVAGVAPHVTLLAIKVAGRSGFATWGSIIAGIEYAANVGANVINMSFGDVLHKDGGNDALLMAALNNAVNYAHSKGALLIASSGNSGINWDQRVCETQDALGNIIFLNCPAGKIPGNMILWNSMKLPAMLPNVLAISATGPQFGLNVDAMAVLSINGILQSYSDFGMSVINFAAPGGSITGFVDPATKMPLDLVLSACARFTVVRGLAGYPCGSGKADIFMAGTSMAAAHVSGVAALVDSAAGGTLTPDQITQILMVSSDQLGKPGQDPWYGSGRINAFRAVTGQ